MIRRYGFRALCLLALLGAACARLKAPPAADKLAADKPAADKPAASPAAARTPLPTRVVGPGVPDTFEPAACMFALPDGFIQGKNVDCGYLVVPENRRLPDTPTIRLAVAIFHPEGGAVHRDPVIYLSGGPGGSALEALRYSFDDAFGAVLATGRDVVVYDQRGVGRSEPALDCPEVDALGWELADWTLDGRELTPDEIGQVYLRAFTACAADLRQRADLTAYHSEASAADLDALRRALGYDPVNLWAGSYGTRLALTVMRGEPDWVRAVLLDAVYPPDVDLYVEGPANAARAFDRFFASCEANAVCREAHPDLASLFDETVARLNEAPVTRTITNTRTGEAYPAVFTGDTLVGMVFQILYDSELRRVLPRLLDAAHAGEFGELDRFRSALASRGSVISRGMYFSVQCHEEVAFSSESALADALARYPVFAGMYNTGVAGRLAFRVCESWDAGAAPSRENEPVRSDIPTLIVVGEFDPITPPAWGYRAAETLSHAAVIEVPWAGHGDSLTPSCAQDAWLAFLERPSGAVEAACSRQ